MNHATQASLALLLGSPVTDQNGSVRGRLQDIAVTTGAAAGNVAGLVIKTREGARMVAAGEVIQTPAGTIELREHAVLKPFLGDENFLLLERDLMDRQIIDVHGHKVVRVNDVDLEWFSSQVGEHLRVSEVEVGLRGGVRRLFKGVVPRSSLESFARYFAPKVIPWEFVDVIEVDPTRRVKLKIEHQLLAKMHPSDIAAILEELAPAEREAVFGALDEEIAADALEEVEPRLQKSLIEALDSERVAEIVEEMDPGAAADLLAELPEERSEAILEKMDAEDRQEVEELLEFQENSAAGRMTTEYVSISSSSLVQDAVRALREFEGDIESITEIYVTGEGEVLEGVIPLARLILAMPQTRASVLADPRVISCPVDAHQDEVAELFDKYNLHALPVVDNANRLVGVVLADHVIAFLRESR